jgi:hypothetical protein
MSTEKYTATIRTDRCALITGYPWQNGIALEANREDYLRRVLGGSAHPEVVRKTILVSGTVLPSLLLICSRRWRCKLTPWPPYRSTILEHGSSFTSFWVRNSTDHLLKKHGHLWSLSTNPRRRRMHTSLQPPRSSSDIACSTSSRSLWTSLHMRLYKGFHVRQGQLAV